MAGVQKFTGRFFSGEGEEYKPPHTLVNLSFLAPPQPNLYCTYTIAPQSVSNVFRSFYVLMKLSTNSDRFLLSLLYVSTFLFRILHVMLIG